MAFGRIVKGSAITVIVSAAAVLSAGQAASNVMAKSNPVLAKSIFFYPARADDAAARALFIANERAMARDFAEDAFAVNPLSGNAIGVMADGMASGPRRDAFIAAAARTTKRRNLLQAVLLSYYSENKAIDESLTTINRIVRVYPKMADAMMPILADALGEPGALPVFERLASDEPPWLNGFLVQAASKPELLPQLKKLRQSIDGQIDIDPAIDSRIMSALLGSDDFEGAYQIYRRMTGRQAGERQNGPLLLGWDTAYPPFDWALNDDPKEYGRVASNGQHLEINVQRGSGGVLASKIFRYDKPIRTVRVTHDLNYPGSRSELRLQVTCQSDQETIIDDPIEASPAVFPVDRRPGDCRIYSLTISGRAQSSEGGISGRIQEIALY